VLFASVAAIHDVAAAIRDGAAAHAARNLS